VKINAEVQMERIRELRQQMGVSQVKLAVMADMDPATLNRLERGTGNPNLKTLERVAEALGVEVADFFPKGPRSSPEPSLFNGDDERDSSVFAETMIALADHWIANVSDPEFNAKNIRGVVDAALDLGDVVSEHVVDLWNALPPQNQRLIITVMEKTNEVAKRGLGRLEDADNAAEFQRRRQKIRERTQEISRISARSA
jgi:transcriptional regulator with XRE-family HTH domain